MTELKNQIKQLIALLRNRDNKAYLFFETILLELDSRENEAIEKILSSGAMTQYSNFTFNEEKSYDSIWSLASRYKSQK